MRSSARVLAYAVGLALVLSAAALADDDRPDEGRITKIDHDARVVTVQDEVGDQWDFYWTESTKVEGDAGLLELKPGDHVHVDYQEREGRKFLTEIRRTSKAKWLKLVGDVRELV